MKEDRNIRTANLQPNKEFSNDYGYVYHYKETSHEFDFDNAQILAFERIGFHRKLIAGVYIPQNPTTIAKSTKLGSLFFHQQKNTHSTHLQILKLVCNCVVPKWGYLNEMLKKISKGSECTVSANYLCHKKLNSIFKSSLLYVNKELKSSPITHTPCCISLKHIQYLTLGMNLKFDCSTTHFIFQHLKIFSRES